MALGKRIYSSKDTQRININEINVASTRNSGTAVQRYSESQIKMSTFPRTAHVNELAPCVQLCGVLGSGVFSFATRGMRKHLSEA